MHVKLAIDDFEQSLAPTTHNALDISLLGLTHPTLLPPYTRNSRRISFEAERCPTYRARSIHVILSEFPASARGEGTINRDGAARHWLHSRSRHVTIGYQPLVPGSSSSGRSPLRFRICLSYGEWGITLIPGEEGARRVARARWALRFARESGDRLLSRDARRVIARSLLPRSRNGTEVWITSG